MKLVSRSLFLLVVSFLTACGVVMEGENEMKFAKTEALIDKIEGARETTQYSETKFQRLLDTFLQNNNGVGADGDTFDDDYELAKDTYDNLAVQYKALGRHFADVYQIQQQNPDLTPQTKMELEGSYSYFQTLVPLMDAVLADADSLLKSYQQADGNKRLAVQETVKLSDLTQQLQQKQQALVSQLAKLVVGLQLTI